MGTKDAEKAQPGRARERADCVSFNALIELVGMDQLICSA